MTFPIAASASGDSCAAWREAKVSGREVPSATKENAVTASGREIAHPKQDASSPTMNVTATSTHPQCELVASP